jgi:hypothetical protein
MSAMTLDASEVAALLQPPGSDIVYPETRSEKPCRFNGRRFIDPGAHAAHGN